MYFGVVAWDHAKNASQKGGLLLSWPFSFTTNIWRSFLTVDQLLLFLPTAFHNISRLETIFPHILCPSTSYYFEAEIWCGIALIEGTLIRAETSPGNGGTILFYKPVVEAYLQELEELEEKTRNALARWCRVKQRSLDETIAVSSFVFITCWFDQNVCLTARCSLWTLGSLLDILWCDISTIRFLFHIMFSGTPHILVEGYVVRLI